MAVCPCWSFPQKLVPCPELGSDSCHECLTLQTGVTFTSATSGNFYFGIDNDQRLHQTLGYIPPVEYEENQRVA